MRLRLARYLEQASLATCPKYLQQLPWRYIERGLCPARPAPSSLPGARQAKAVQAAGGVDAEEEIRRTLEALDAKKEQKTQPPRKRPAAASSCDRSVPEA